jgi:hypothetical protein
MCSKSDYVMWDDVDLDSILVEYTDDDAHNVLNSDSSSDSGRVE